MDTIYDRIKKDHDLHRKLLAGIAETSGDSEERRKLWSQFYYDVKSHAAAEEETFYSKLMENPEGQDEARHSVAEHKELDDIMEELQEIDFSSPGWLKRFGTLKHEYEHHMEEEENEIFAKGQKVFSDKQAAEFGKRFSKPKTAEQKLVDEKAESSLEE